MWEEKKGKKRGEKRGEKKGPGEKGRIDCHRKKGNWQEPQTSQ